MHTPSRPSLVALCAASLFSACASDEWPQFRGPTGQGVSDARDLPVTMEIMKLEDARAAGARALFGEKDEENVKVYTLGDFSKEVCGGPHVERTGLLGKFRIQKEQSSSSGVRRIYAVLE